MQPLHVLVPGSGNDSRPSVGGLDIRSLAAGEGLPAVWWVGVHGGAGESVLETLFRGSRASGHRWPLSADGRRVPVVLVARTDARGLAAVQAAMHDRADRGLAVDVLGLVLMADAPARLPKGLRDLIRVVSGGVPSVWCVPFVEAWRMGETPTRRNSPSDAALLRDELQALLAKRQEEQ